MIYKPNVLVCDDHLDIRRELAMVLRENGLKVYLARSGSEALTRMSSDNVGVAVLDLRMPGKMDGIQTAQKIKSDYPDVRIIFLTAFDNKDYRNRAARANLRIDRWIDKGPKWLDKTQQAVLEAFGYDLLNKVTERLNRAAEAAGITSEQLAVIKQHLAWYELLPPSGLELQPRPSVLPVPPAEPASLEFEDVLQRLTYYLEETRLGYSDPAHRQIAWDQFREVTLHHLWPAVESSGFDEYRQQLAVQLERAVRKIEDPFLTLKHLDATRLSIERLLSEKVGQHDISACKKAWRQAGIEMLPSFKTILQKWEELYSIEGPEDEVD